jgi:hypothetical protein
VENEFAGFSSEERAQRAQVVFTMPVNGEFTLDVQHYRLFADIFAPGIGELWSFDATATATTPIDFNIGATQFGGEDVPLDVSLAIVDPPATPVNEPDGSYFLVSAILIFFWVRRPRASASLILQIRRHGV